MLNSVKYIVHIVSCSIPSLVSHCFYTWHNGKNLYFDITVYIRRIYSLSHKIFYSKPHKFNFVINWHGTIKYDLTITKMLVIHLTLDERIFVANIRSRMDFEPGLTHVRIGSKQHEQWKSMITINSTCGLQYRLKSGLKKKKKTFKNWDFSVEK